MNSSSETLGIDLLFKKLGHDIVEIRTRSLESILSKLEHNLIQDGDLVQERQLFIRLLEWFNFEQSPLQAKVLQLLERLTKHSSACDLLASIGAVSFLTQLRGDVDANLRHQVDTLLNRLFHITDREISKANCRDRRCVYGRSHDSTEASQSSQDNPERNYGYFTPASNDSVSSSIPPAPKMVRTTPLPAPPTPQASTAPQCLRFPGFPWHSLTGTDRHVLTSTGASLCSPSPQLVRNACAFLLDVIFRDFPPEIFLQRPSIVRTLITLISSRPGGQLIVNALECLQSLTEGLLARVNFFQDPTMYCPRQGLPFHGESVGSAGGRSTLDSLAGSVDQQLLFASRAQAEGAIRLERSGGDGRELSSSSSATNSTQITPLSRRSPRAPSLAGADGGGLDSMSWNTITNEMDNEAEQDVAGLRRLQMSAPHLCVSALQATLPSLKTESTQLALCLLQCVVPLIHVLEKTVQSDKLWVDRSMEAQSLSSTANEVDQLRNVAKYVEKQRFVSYVFAWIQAGVRDLLETFGDVLMFHHDATTTASEHRSSRHEARMHRLVYQAVVTQLLDFLTVVLPLEQVGREAKSGLVSALFAVSCDRAVQLAQPDSCEQAIAYLEACSGERHAAVARCRKVARAFDHAQLFRSELQVGGSMNLEAMELAESSIDGLGYHCDAAHIKQLVRAVSAVFATHRPATAAGASTEQVRVTGKRVLLCLLSHGVVRVRRAAYDECLAIVREGVNVDTAAANPGNTASVVCRFLLDDEILYEICCHGLGDNARLVALSAQELMVLMLGSRLLVSADVWWDFCHALQTVLPVLQAYTGDCEIVRSAVEGYLSPAEHAQDEGDERVVLLRACVRALMLKHRASRATAAARLLQLVKLSDDDDTAGLAGLTDVLTIDSPLPLVPRDHDTRFHVRRCVFQHDAIARMLDVFRSSTSDESIRVGALRQLATMLEDPALHPAFAAGQGLAAVVARLVELSRLPVLTEADKPTLAACVQATKLVLRADAVERGRLSCDATVLTALVRAASLARASVAISSEIVVVIGLLAFHDVLRVYVRSSTATDGEVDDDVAVGGGVQGCVELSLPVAVVARYQVPFICPSHHAASVHRSLVHAEDDALRAEPVSARYLRVAWWLARYENDVAAAVRATDEAVTPAPMGSEDDIIDLRLTANDRLSLTFADADRSAAAFVDLIVAAQSHPAAARAFALLRVAMMTSLPPAARLVAALLHSDEWKAALEKFLQVSPTCYEDEVLLAHVTSLLDEMLASVERERGGGDDEFATWLLERCLLGKQHRAGSPLLRVLESPEPQPEPVGGGTGVGGVDHRQPSLSVRRLLCKRILTMLARVSRLVSRHPSQTCNRFHRELQTVILVRLRLADAPQFYDLPSMEVTLECLVHVSSAAPCCHGYGAAKERGKEIDPDVKVLLKQLLGTLLEIVSAFHIGSGASNLSYMGKGVSRCAAQCILHIAREMSAVGATDWSNHLEYATAASDQQQQPAPPSASGLEWVVPLWSARDPRTRYAGLAIACLASRTRQGCGELTRGLHRYHGGLWNTVLGVVLDHSECSAVRTQACDLLRNLVSHPFDSPSPPDRPPPVGEDSSFQGPIVQGGDSDGNLAGLPALLALVRHAHVAEHVALALTRFHPHSCVRSPVDVFDPLSSRPLSAAGSESEGFRINAGSRVTTSSPLTQPNVQPPVFQAFDTNRDSFASGNNDRFARHAVISPQASAGDDDVNAMTSPDDWRALTTPSLVRAMSALLSNLAALAPHNIVASIAQNDLLAAFNRLVDFDRLQRLAHKLAWQQSRDPECALKRNRRRLVSRALVEQRIEHARLLTACVAAEPRALAPRLACADSPYIATVASIFRLHIPDDDVVLKKLVRRARKCALEFMSVLLHHTIKLAAPLPQVFVHEWPVIFDGIDLGLKSAENQLASLTTVALLFHAEHSPATKRQSCDRDTTLTWLVENKKVERSGGERYAEELCARLTDIFERVVVDPSCGVVGADPNIVLTACTRALQTLFACSKLAGRAAVQAGFLERCVQEMKRLHLRLTLRLNTSAKPAAPSTLLTDSASRSSSTADEYDMYFQPLILLCTVITNLMYENDSFKIEASKSDVGLVINNLWKWIPSSPHLLTSLLKLIVTYVAECEQACASLALAPPSGGTSVMWSLVQTCRQLHPIVLSRTKLAPPTLLHLVFAALTNCACAPECRAVIWKANLMDLFAQVADRCQHPKRSKLQSSLLDHWLHLLLALTFHTDGQLNVLKIRDIFEILLELHAWSSDHVIRIIRNLCFHASSKNRISSCGGVVKMLMTSLEEKKSQNITVSAFLSLLHNSQKAKVHLKGAGLVKTVQNALARLTLDQEDDHTETTLSFKTSLTDMVKILES